jgi:hypothetical protein
MQSLQTKKKLVISLGVITAIVAVSSTMMLSVFFSDDLDSELTPTNNMPVPGSNTPEMIVSDDVSIGMPVPGSNTPEMLVSDNSNSMIRNSPN